MLSVPRAAGSSGGSGGGGGGGVGGGGGGGGGGMDHRDSCQAGEFRALTQRVLPDDGPQLTAATAATRETPSTLGNPHAPLLKAPHLSAAPGHTPPSPNRLLALQRPDTPSDYYHHQHYNSGNPLLGTVTTTTTQPSPPPSVISAASRVKMNVAESPLTSSSPSSSSALSASPPLSLDLGPKHHATLIDSPDTVEDDDDENEDDDTTNNNTALDHLGTQLKTSTTTKTKATVDAVGGEHSGSGSGGGPVRNLRVRGQRKFLPEKTRHKRQTLQDMTRPLKQWLIRHKDNPYPSKAQKMDLVSKSQMTLTQVSNWFANARRRLKNTVKQPDLSWASRIKLYNSCVEGNAELFSLCSDDSCLDSDDGMMEHRQSDTFHDDVTDSLTSSRTATPDVTAGSGEACSNFNHGSSSGGHGNNNNNNNNHHHHHRHSYHHSNSNSSSNSGPSSSGPSGPHPHPCPGLEETCASFPKYKHSILHRYLSDSHQQALILDEDSVAKSRDRHHSSSTGSRDFEELSTSSVSSPAHESVHHDHLDDFSEEFETMALRRRTSDISSSQAREEDMYWKEIGAALALTSLAKGRVVRI